MYLYTLFQNNFEILIFFFFLTTVVLIILLFAIYLFNNKETLQIINNSILNLIIFYSLLIGLNLLYFSPSVDMVLCNGLLYVDELSQFIQFFLTSCLTIYILLQCNNKNNLVGSFFEQNIIILLSVIGLFFLNFSYNFILLYLALELQSLSFYILAALNKKSPLSAEAALKYFILGAIASGFLLYGISIIYGITGSLNFGNISTLLTHFNQFENLQFLITIFYGLLFIIVGLLFKIGAVPFHFWLPDVYEGSPNLITVFFAIFPKIVLINVLIHLFFDTFNNIFNFFQPIFYCCSILSILIGSFLALKQKKIKRLLAYSSISHVGFLLIGFTINQYQSLESILFYLLVYTIMTINIWVIFLSIKKNQQSIKYLTDFTNLSKLNPVLSIILILNVFSIAGVPPLAGFFSKMFILSFAIKNLNVSLAILAILLSVVSAVYYIRLIKIVYFDNTVSTFSINQVTKIESLIITISGFFIIFYCFFPEYIIILLKKLTLLFLI